MTHYPTQKLDVLAARRATRYGYVQAAQRAAADNIYTVHRIIEVALPHAREEEAEFQREFGEAMPRHMRRCLEEEITMWERLENSLAEIADHTDLHKYTENVRTYLAIQGDYLRMQQEMVHSCLGSHYDVLREYLLGAAAEVTI